MFRVATSFALLLLSLALGAPNRAQAQANSCPGYYTSSIPVPTGFAAAYDVFSTFQSQLSKVDCSVASTPLTIGLANSPSQLIYHLAYVSNGGPWVPLTLTSAHTLRPDGWYPQQAGANLSLTSTQLQNWTYIAFLEAQLVGNVYKWGCADTTCANPMWSVQAIEQATATVTLAANPTLIAPSGSSTLTWSSTVATGCTGTNFNPTGTSGSVTVSPSATTTYSITCGSATTSATVTVGSSTTVTASLTATPASITVGSSSTLTWSSTNATGCVGTNFTANGTAGSVSVSPSATTTYSVTCTGTNGSASSSVTVNVTAVNAATLTLTVTPSAPSIVNTSPGGSTVATLSGSWSDGSPFTGSFIFVAPNLDSNGTYAISGNTLVTNPSGPGLPSPGTVDHVTLEAQQ